MDNKYLLIVGGTSEITNSIYDITRFDSYKVIIIGQTRPKFECSFVKINLHEKIDQFDVEKVKNILKGAPISQLYWFAGSYEKVELGSSRLLDEVSNQLNISCVNLLFMINSFLEELKIGRCQIVTLSSLLAHKESVNSIAYNVGKASQNSLVRNLALALGPYGICINSISPSLFKSKMSEGVFENNEKLNSIRESSALKKIPSASSIANMVLYLSSPNSLDITGQDFVIDCGNSLGF